MSGEEHVFDERQFTRAFDLAAQQRDTPRAKALVEGVAKNRGALSEQGREALTESCLRGDAADALREAWAAIPSLRPRDDAQKFSLLRLAVHFGAPETLKVALELGADCGRQNRHGETPLIELSRSERNFWSSHSQQRERSLECVRILWAQGEQARRPGAEGQTALEAASGANEDQPFFELMKLGANEPLARAENTLWAAAIWPLQTQARFNALRPRVPQKAWSASGAIAGVAARGNFAMVEWLLDRQLGLGNPRFVNRAVLDLVHCAETGRPAPRRLVERLLPLCDLFANSVEGRPGCGGVLSCVLGTMSQRHARLYAPWADLIASFEPRQPGARELWERFEGSAERLPLLHAQVEAETLRQALLEFSAKNAQKGEKANFGVESTSAAAVAEAQEAGSSRLPARRRAISRL